MASIGFFRGFTEFFISNFFFFNRTWPITIHHEICKAARGSVYQNLQERRERKSLFIIEELNIEERSTGQRQGRISTRRVQRKKMEEEESFSFLQRLRLLLLRLRLHFLALPLLRLLSTREKDPTNPLTAHYQQPGQSFQRLSSFLSLFLIVFLWALCFSRPSISFCALLVVSFCWWARSALKYRLKQMSRRKYKLSSLIFVSERADLSEAPRFGWDSRVMAWILPKKINRKRHFSDFVSTFVRL